MTAFTIALADGRQAQVEADEITTRNDGSLWLGEPRPAKPEQPRPRAL